MSLVFKLILHNLEEILLDNNPSSSQLEYNLTTCTILNAILQGIIERALHFVIAMLLCVVHRLTLNNEKKVTLMQKVHAY